MPTWLSEISAFGVFLSIAGVGFIFLLISLLFGELFEHGLDHGLDHGGPGFFSVRIISVFITAFGGFGAVGTHYGLSVLASSGLGFGSGVVFSSIIYAFARFLYGQQASSEVRAADLVGQSARVVVSIPVAGVGQVRCRMGEELVDKVARSHDGQAIPENGSVRIEEVLGDMVVVRRQ